MLKRLFQHGLNDPSFTQACVEQLLQSGVFDSGGAGEDRGGGHHRLQKPAHLQRSLILLACTPTL